MWHVHYDLYCNGYFDNWVDVSMMMASGRCDYVRTYEKVECDPQPVTGGIDGTEYYYRFGKVLWDRVKGFGTDGESLKQIDDEIWASRNLGDRDNGC